MLDLLGSVIQRSGVVLFCWKFVFDVWLLLNAFHQALLVDN